MSAYPELPPMESLEKELRIAQRDFEVDDRRSISAYFAHQHMRGRIYADHARQGAMNIDRIQARIDYLNRLEAAKERGRRR